MPSLRLVSLVFKQAFAPGFSFLGLGCGGSWFRYESWLYFSRSCLGLPVGLGGLRFGLARELSAPGFGFGLERSRLSLLVGLLSASEGSASASLGISLLPAPSSSLHEGFQLYGVPQLLAHGSGRPHEIAVSSESASAPPLHESKKDLVRGHASSAQFRNSSRAGLPALASVFPRRPFDVGLGLPFASGERHRNSIKTQRRHSTEPLIYPVTFPLSSPSFNISAKLMNDVKEGQRQYWVHKSKHNDDELCHFSSLLSPIFSLGWDRLLLQER